MDISNYVWLIDRCPQRRRHLNYALVRSQVHVVPFEDARDFLVHLPGDGVVMVHDDEPLLRSLADGLAATDRSYPYVVYTEKPDWMRAVSVMSKGASDYVALPLNPAAISDVLDSASTSTRKTSHQRQLATTGGELLARITRREADVLSGIVAGLTNREIAGKLGISSRTVEVHRASVFKKTGAKNGPDLVRIAMDANFNS